MKELALNVMDVGAGFGCGVGSGFSFPQEKRMDTTAAKTGKVIWDILFISIFHFRAIDHVGT